MLIYLARNKVNGKCYVGKTIGTLERRWCEHKRAAKRGSPYHFHRAINKHGSESFNVSVICYANNHTELYQREQETIAAYRAQGVVLYNISSGGPGNFGLKHSDETRAKIRAARKIQTMSPETCKKISTALMGNKHLLGHHHNKEVVEKIAIKNRGRKRSPETCAKIGAIHRGRKRPLETCNKIRAKALGRKRSIASRAKQGLAMKGHVFGLERNIKISKALKGRTFSPETRAKISAAAKNRSLETRAKMSNAQKKRMSNIDVSPETRAKLSASLMGNKHLLGHHHGPETRAKMSASHIGSHRSAETRAKMSAANFRRWAKYREAHNSAVTQQ